MRISELAASPVVAWPDAGGAELFRGGPRRHDLAAHRSVFGCGLERSPDELVGLIEQSGLLGRGGARFPLAVKLAAARRDGVESVVIVNLSESEPASRKDTSLGCWRPHLLLDGARAVAASVGASEVTIRFHAGARALESSLAAAIDERRGGSTGFLLSSGPRRYVAGEGSAVASAIAGGRGLPLHKTVPLAIKGPSGRPTVVLNAETAAHVGLLGSDTIERWRSSGPEGTSGTRLLTLAGAVRAPGAVVELTGPGTFAELLAAQGVHATPGAVLVGGYAGTWFEGHTLMDLEVSDVELEPFGASLGCGVIAVIPQGRCALAEVARVARYLADESAGQCGPCVQGLPEVADIVDSLVRGKVRSRQLRRLASIADEIEGRGACAHPDATLRMVRSALAMLPTEVDRHLGGRSCVDHHHHGVLPLGDPR
jgi:NADH:ubiquinone oxidoreductase subunit F (NADH-binding)